MNNTSDNFSLPKYPRSFDHYILPTNNLQITAELWRHLGFRLLDFAEHEGLGTSNHVIQFDKSYFELLDFSKATGMFKTFFEAATSQRRGIAALSVTTNNLEEDIEEITKKGFSFTPINHVIRPVNMPDGSIDQIDSYNSPAYYAKAPVMGMFLTNHRRPDVTYSEKGKPQPNGAVKTVGFVYVADEPTAHKPYFSAFLGEPSMDSTEKVVYPTTTGSIEILNSKALAQEYSPDIAKQNEVVRNHPLLLRLASVDIAATRSFFDTHSIKWISQGDSVIIPATSAEGVAVEFVPSTK